MLWQKTKIAIGSACGHLRLRDGPERRPVGLRLRLRVGPAEVHA
jgi:hypothetical protein